MEKEKKELICDEMSQKIVSVAESLVLAGGARGVNVRMILKELDITNRVFYNRFHNIDEVLAIVYENIALEMRETLKAEIDPDRDFFEQMTEMVGRTLEMSYTSKMQFNNYVFENDSLSRSNYEWWTGEIKKIIEYAMEKGHIKEVDSDILSYSIWCFCRGYNADAVGRGLPMDKAVEGFKYSFGLLLDGMKKQ